MQAPNVRICGTTLSRMVDRQLLQFSARLQEVCTDLGLPVGRGRDSQFARMFKVTPNAARKWLHGQGMPELQRAIQIADRANVSATWLLQGMGPKNLPGATQLGIALATAVGSLPDESVTEVADYVLYKLSRLDDGIAAEDLTLALNYARNKPSGG